MPPLTLVQKRALLAAANNVQKIKRAEMPVFRRYRDSLNLMGQPTQNTPRLAAELDTMKRKWREGVERLLRLERKLGVKDFDTKNLSRNVISNLIKKHGGLALIRKKLWLKGLEAELERARANFRNFEKGVFHQKSNLIGESHRKKTPSPPKRVTPRRASPPPANNAHRRVHGIGPANNARITWSRNANGKINRFKTLENINMRLSQAERNALNKMTENQAMNTIRQLARER
jgi:hypothetical protein